MDYDSLNVIECLGSINLFFWFGGVYVFIVILARCFSCTKASNKKCCGKKYLSVGKARSISLRFLQGVFFEVTLSASIGMRMFKIWEYTNFPDRLSIDY